MVRGDVEKILRLYREIDAEIGHRLEEIGDIDAKYKMPPKEVAEDRQRIYDEISELGAFRGLVRQEIDHLPTYEKAVVTKFYFARKSLVHIAGQIHYSEPQCRNIKRRALERLAERFEKNKTIGQYYRSLSDL